MSLYPDAIPVCTDPGWTEAVPLSERIRVLFYDDGTVRFEHLCDRTVHDRGTIVCSPALQTGPHGTRHRVVSRVPLTITPSILCPDCGTHGFVTDGKWVAA